MNQFVTSRSEGRISVCRINRREKLNAITTDMYRALTETLLGAEKDREIRVHLLFGTDDCFTAGNDMGDFLNNPPTDESSPVFHFLNTISSLQKPLVAGVSGAAIGIGTTLLLHCDIAVAGTQARFQMPFTKLGLCPEAGSSVLLPLSAGYRLAAELLFLGEPFDATVALRAGLVNEVVADSDVEAVAFDKAKALAALPPHSVQLTKRLLKQPFAKNVADAIVDESGHFLKRLNSAEAQEALTAFMEKRRPDFSTF